MIVFGPPLILVDNVFDFVNLYPNATVDSTVASAFGTRPQYVSSYRRERSQWQAAAAAANAGVKVDLGAEDTCAVDSVWIDRGHNLWGQTVQIVSATNAGFSTGVTTTSLTVPAEGTIGGDPTSATMCVTEEGALYSLFAAHAARRYIKLQVSEIWKPILTTVILGARVQLLVHSAKLDDDAGGRVLTVQESDVGYQAIDRVYSYRTIDLNLSVIGATEYDGTIRSLRRLLFERNQPAFVVMTREAYPERGWLYQYSEPQWASGTQRVYRSTNLQMREIGSLIPDPTAPPEEVDTTDFILWLQADKPQWPSLALPADDALLVQQNDTTGLGNHGVARTSGGKPRFELAIQNGLPGVFFDANNYGDGTFAPCDGLIFPDAALVALSEGEAYFVLQLLADPPTNGLFSGLWQFHRNPDTDGRSSYRSPSDLHVYIAFGGLPMDCGIAPLDLTEAHIVHVTASPTRRSVSFNGVLVHEEDGSLFSGFPRVGSSEAFSTLGGDADAFGSMMGWEHEFIFASPIAGPSQIAVRHTYLSNKWNVALGLKSSVETLVVAGGGSGGWTPAVNAFSGGGGGAGRVIYKPAHLIVPGSYPIVVGAGGAGGIATSNNGGDSTFDTIVAKGGGKGASDPGTNGDVAGSAGGSGGGGQRSGGGGTTLAGSTGGAVAALIAAGNVGGNGHNFSGCGGGGGGAGGFGTSANFGSNVGTAGGPGVASSISGASVTYGAGGGSGGYADAGGAGGTGGGGAGGGNRTNGSNATGVGCGGGGAGSSGSGAACSSGSGSAGKVVIRYPTAKFGTCTGGTITTSGSDTIHTFTANGTFVLVAA